MFNVGGGELLVIFLVALIVLGPAKLPEVARQVGGVMREVRRISAGFQDEMRAAMDDPVEAAARDRGNKVVSSAQKPAPTRDEQLADEDDPDGTDDDAGRTGAASGDGDGDGDEGSDADDAAAAAPPMSTAAAAGMYDVVPTPPTEPARNPYLTPVGTRAQPPAGEPPASDDPDVAVDGAPRPAQRGENDGTDTAADPDPDERENGSGDGPVSEASEHPTDSA